MKIKSTIITVVALIVIVVGVWYFQRPESASGEPIKIGVATVLTGDFAVLGENIVNAAMIAVDDVNKSGGVNGRPLELVIEDAGLDGKTGLSANNKLVNVDNVKYIIGGTSSNGTMSSAPLVNDNKIIYLTPVTGGSNVDNAGEYIFRIANSDLLAGRDIAVFMMNSGYKKVGVISENTEYTLDLKNTFEEYVEKMGGQIVFSEVFQPGTVDFRTLVSKTEISEPEAIFVASQTGIAGAHFIKQARDKGADFRIFSDFTLVTNSSAKDIVGSFDGVYFAAPAYSDNNRTREFFEKYENVHGEPPFIPFHAASTYDGVMMISSALKEAGDDSEKVHDWLLKNVKNWEGLMGEYSLDDKGNSDLGFDIKVVQGDEFVKLEE